MMKSDEKNYDRELKVRNLFNPTDVVKVVIGWVNWVIIRLMK